LKYDVLKNTRSELHLKEFKDYGKVTISINEIHVVNLKIIISIIEI